MKKLLFLASMLLAVSMFTSCDDEKIVSESDLPSSSREFLKTHFDGIAVTTVMQERDGIGKEYTVFLSNGFQISFEKKGAWDEVNGFQTELPQSFLALLPAGITQYVANFPEAKIVDVNKEPKGYEVKLSNGTELEFDSNGNLIEID
jgi:hypothetical protein